MTEEEIELAMTAAAARDDFEEATRLRNALFLMRAGGGSQSDLDADFAGIRRQQPGAMGIGSQFPRPARPDGWKPPTKPDLMTRGSSRRGKGRAGKR